METVAEMWPTLMSAIDLAAFVFAAVLAVGIIVAIIRAWYETLRR